MAVTVEALLPAPVGSLLWDLVDEMYSVEAIERRDDAVLLLLESPDEAGPQRYLYLERDGYALYALSWDHAGSEAPSHSRPTMADIRAEVSVSESIQAYRMTTMQQELDRLTRFREQVLLYIILAVIFLVLVLFLR